MPITTSLLAAAVAVLAGSTQVQPGSTQTVTENGVTARLTVGADRRASDCEIVASSGNSATDAATCRTALRSRRAGSRLHRPLRVEVPQAPTADPAFRPCEEQSDGVGRDF